MPVQIKGVGSISGLDQGIVVGIVTSSTQINVGSNIKFGSAGIATASNFKTGSSNLHSTGLTVGNNFLHTTGINVGTGATIHVPASNTLTFGTNSNERVRITSAGDVGIGTAIPVVASGYGNLSLAGSTGGQLEFKRVSNDTRHYIWGHTDLNIGGGYHNGSSSNIIFRVNGATERLRIMSNGDIGINTSVINRADTGRPCIQFDYGGNDGSEGLEIRLSNSTLNGNAATDNAAITYIGQNLGITNRENGVITFRNNGSERLRIQANGRILVNTTTDSSANATNTGYNSTGDLVLMSRGNNSNALTLVNPDTIANNAALGTGLAGINFASRNYYTDSGKTGIHYQIIMGKGHHQYMDRGMLKFVPGYNGNQAYDGSGSTDDNTIQFTWYGGIKTRGVNFMVSAVYGLSNSSEILTSGGRAQLQDHNAH